MGYFSPPDQQVLLQSGQMYFVAFFTLHFLWVCRIFQEATNGPNIDWQDKIHRRILRGLRNISETP